MMNLDVEKYLCTACGHHFILADGVHQDDGSVREGKLVCRTCGIHYPVIGGIPRFVSAENYAGSFGYQWNIHRRTQLDSFTGLSLSRARLFTVSGWPSNMEGERILEAGSGAGRFTEILLKTGAEIYSFDFSIAVEANQLNNGASPNLHLFQGDIFKVPLPSDSFDKVMCLGVLQHTPDPEKAFKSLTRYVRPGGSLVIDVYRSNLASLLNWKYVLRPITKRISQQRLYRIIEQVAPQLVPVSAFFRKYLGRAGMRLIPILQYEHWGLPPELNKKWAVLDTFDMLSPAYDLPQSLKTVRAWFNQAGFENIVVQAGPNGVTGRGTKPRPIK
jgi:SAM-dependent methyltransferase